MKTLLKYISLLIISGLIIPYYHAFTPTDIPLAKKDTVVKCPKTGASKNGGGNSCYFSFIADVVAKILPVVKNFN